MFRFAVFSACALCRAALTAALPSLPESSLSLSLSSAVLAFDGTRR